MIRRLRFFTFFMFVLCHLCDVCASDQVDPINATVEIFADSGKQIQVGTGFFISAKGDIATAYHVIAGAKSLQIISHQGSYSKYAVKAYDPSKDLAIISVAPPGNFAFDFIPLGPPPNSLLGKNGIVVGHPDLKKDFSVRVTFPRDRPLLSGEWATAIQGSGTRWIFAKSDVRLIALDGTLNHGMSGGPVLVDGKAIGVFSGGEEQSGGGLGWAISAEYLANLPSAPLGNSLETLPPLTLLTQNSEKPALMKAVQTPFGKEFFPTLMDIAATKSNMLAFAPVSLEIQKSLVECEPYLNSISPASKAQTPVSGSKEQDCLLATLVVTKVILMEVDALKKFISSAGPSTDIDIRSLLDKKISTAGTLDVKQGIFRTVGDVGSKCDIKVEMKERLRTFDEKAAKLEQFLAPLKKIPPFPPPESENATSNDQLASEVLAYLRHDYGKTLVSSLISTNAQIPSVLESASSLVEPWIGCLEAIMRVVDFQPNLKRSREPVDPELLNATERAYFVGLFFGFYYGTVAMADGCQKRFGAMPGLEEGAFRFKQRHLLYLQQATEIGSQSMGQAGIDDLKETGAKMVPGSINKILDDMDHKGLGKAFCKSIAAHMDESNIAVYSPDTAEAISGNAVDRGKLPTINLVLQKTFADVFSGIFQKNLEHEGSLISAVFPGFVRVMILSWESNLILQCSQLGSPLPNDAELQLKQIEKKNLIIQKREKEKLIQKIVSSGGAKTQIDGVWTAIDAEANEMNQSFMREFNIQTSANLATACLNFLNPDIQEHIGTLLVPSDAELSKVMAD
jgi:hypothetical protein